MRSSSTSRNSRSLQFAPSLRSWFAPVWKKVVCVIFENYSKIIYSKILHITPGSKWTCFLCNSIVFSLYTIYTTTFHYFSYLLLIFLFLIYTTSFARFPAFRSAQFAAWGCQQYQARVDAINRLEPTIKALSDEQLQAKTAELKAQLAKVPHVSRLNGLSYFVLTKLTLSPQRARECCMMGYFSWALCPGKLLCTLTHKLFCYGLFTGLLGIFNFFPLKHRWPICIFFVNGWQRENLRLILLVPFLHQLAIKWSISIWILIEAPWRWLPGRQWMPSSLKPSRWLEKRRGGCWVSARSMCSSSVA